MNIALAIIRDPTWKLTLVGIRANGSHLGGRWEFPGGKIEPNETAPACAVREAAEETGVQVRVCEHWPPVTHAYPDVAVTLHPFLCTTDLAQPLEPWRWEPICDLDPSLFPEANRSLIELLQRRAEDYQRDTRFLAQRVRR